MSNEKASLGSNLSAASSSCEGSGSQSEQWMRPKWRRRRDEPSSQVAIGNQQNVAMVGDFGNQHTVAIAENNPSSQVAIGNQQNVAMVGDKANGEEEGTQHYGVEEEATQHYPPPEPTGEIQGEGPRRSCSRALDAGGRVVRVEGEEGRGEVGAVTASAPAASAARPRRTTPRVLPWTLPPPEPPQAQQRRSAAPRRRSAQQHRRMPLSMTPAAGGDQRAGPFSTSAQRDRTGEAVEMDPANPEYWDRIGRIKNTEHGKMMRRERIKEGLQARRARNAESSASALASSETTSASPRSSKPQVVLQEAVKLPASSDAAAAAESTSTGPAAASSGLAASGLAEPAGPVVAEVPVVAEPPRPLNVLGIIEALMCDEEVSLPPLPPGTTAPLSPRSRRTAEEEEATSAFAQRMSARHERRQKGEEEERERLREEENAMPDPYEPTEEQIERQREEYRKYQERWAERPE